MTRIAVLDFGMGNLRSVAKALEAAGASVDVLADVPGDADGLVVPGQGHFGACMTNLGARSGDVSAWISSGRPYLGICLGLQVLFESSEEAPSPGLALLPGKVRRFQGQLKVPHIGWNEVRTTRDTSLFAGTSLFDGIANGTRFYFVHSYYPDPADESVVAATTDYGVEFACAVSSGAMAATQFHPEKSGGQGIAVLRNFLRMCA